MKRRKFIRDTITGSLVFSGLSGTINLFSGSFGTQEIIDLESDEFEFNRFANPDSFYWPAYFWLWNDTVNKEIILKQLEDMALMGALSVCLHPMPKAFRPNTMFTLMTPDYMTSDYLDLFRYAAEQCQRLKMRMYLYDEGGWPSGACLGNVVDQNPSLIRQALSRQLFDPEKGSSFTIPPDCLSGFLFQGNIKIKQLIPGTTEIIDIENAHIMVFSVTKGGTWWPYPYPDLLNPESTKEFLRLTHEEYKNSIGAYFGSLIKITFTDEAQVANPGWTDDLSIDFKGKFGYEIRNELPSIFEGDDENDRRIRIDYFNWWSQRHAESYYGQIQKWCHKNNLLSGGHLSGEDGTVNARLNGYGHPLRSLRRMDVPGIDVIWRQVWPGGKNHHFPKYASSVSHQKGLSWSLSESFSAFGTGLTASQMKWTSDYQYVRGINLLVLSNYPLSTKDYFLGGLRPMFGPGNPLWKYMDDYHVYIARLSYLLSLGKPGIKMALYYPINDIWAGGSELNTVCSSNDDLARILLENQCDFDLIDDDVLDCDSTRIINGHIEVGPMCYDTVCVSHNRYMAKNSVLKLEQFIASGGKVFWFDNATFGLKPKGTILTTLSDLPSIITPTVTLESPNVNIRVCKRNINNGSVYFVTNEGAFETTCNIQFNETLPIIQIDPGTGKCWVPSLAFRNGRNWTIPLILKFAGSCVFIFTNDPFPVIPEPSIPDKVLQSLSEGWTCHKIREFVIGEHDMEVHEISSDQPVNIELGDWRKVIGDIYSGDIEYMVRFKCSDSVKKNARVLDLGDVRYVCNASLNGELLGKRLWQPFSYDIKNKLRKGYNILKITVTNTLANQYTYSRVLDKWPLEKLGPYHIQTLGYEKESVSSGLLGPVTIK